MAKLLNILFIPIITLAILWAIGWLWFASMIYLMPAQKTEQQTDAIIVLTGGSGRISEGLDLLQEKTAPKLFISGVDKGVSKSDILAQWENPTTPAPCCIELGYKSTDTISNATEINDWTKDNNINSFTLVTSAYHMPRAKMEVKRQIVDKEIYPYPVISKILKNNHWRFIKITFSEYNKYLIRWIKNFKKDS